MVTWSKVPNAVYVLGSAREEGACQGQKPGACQGQKPGDQPGLMAHTSLERALRSSNKLTAYQHHLFVLTIPYHIPWPYIPVLHRHPALL